MDERTLVEMIEAFIESNIGLEKTADWKKILPGKNIKFIFIQRAVSPLYLKS